MIKEYLHSKSMTLVFLGDFNPILFQPLWFAEKKLIMEGEAQQADIEILHPNLTKFKLDWVEFEINPGRLEMKISKEPFFEPARDLIVGIFKYLKGTPIRSLGINHTKNFSVPTREMYYDFGNKLVPLALWSNFMDDPRVNIVEILEKPRKDKLPGMIRVRITPTLPHLNIQFGVSMNVNDHYQLEEGRKDREGEILNTLVMQWDYSKTRSDEIVDSLLEKLN